MLRFKILASVVPLMAAAVFARGDFLPGARPCIAIGEASVQMTSLPWQAQFHVSFTSDPGAATVRVQLSDSAEAADFTVIDDIDSAEDSACAANPTTRFVGVTSSSSSISEPVIYLSANGPADYRIYVHSKRFSAHDAAALVVGAGAAPRRIEAASL